MLEHGGRLNVAARRYGIPREAWLDLSTGINPCGWPVPELPAAVWQRLPEDDDGLAAAAAAYYGGGPPLAVAGSQAAIQILPRLRPAGRVAVLSPGYAEHAAAWRVAGHAVIEVPAEGIAALLERIKVLVLINPNNPTGTRFAADQLLAWHQRLAARGGWLVVDEAFMDAEPGDSLVAAAGRPGLVVLRSLGKFFGLAGARVGFLFAEAALQRALAARLGPWAVAAPAREVARRALADGDWQARTRQRLGRDALRLAALLRAHGLPPAGGTALFQWLPHPRAAELAEAFARQAVLVRHFEAPASLRFGLPGTAADWARLETVLERVTGEAAAHG
ncbi:threonine-phosphate decarboxylase CobD [Thiohalobacter sp. IOR34]|uniref:threonine-phosphate decarboxylase CobD n=1 Tax=Thiohalobacter sp. IOR34 TaxID=3057176 RepID=UPI0025B0B2A7|nr:threonine-phosphate decarboxylase CobD [Thiohalobacter sp. IOR34]WJW75155.1 threonine-phosphate decarboxylase CobD [Thiohalobacter sp. IOR34]